MTMAIETGGCRRAIERLVGYPPVDLDAEISPLGGGLEGGAALVTARFRDARGRRRLAKLVRKRLESRRVRGISPQAAERLLSYSWPGNVRELQNCMERAVALTSFEDITVEDLPEKVRDYRSSHIIIASEDPAELAPLEEVERRYILKVYQSVGGNKSLAARVLGMNRRTLYRKLEEYSVDTGTRLGEKAVLDS